MSVSWINKKNKKLFYAVSFPVLATFSLSAYAALPISVVSRPSFPQTVGAGQSVSLTYTLKSNLRPGITLAPSLNTNSKFTHATSGTITQTGGTCVSGVSGGNTCTIILSYAAPSAIPSTNPATATIQFQPGNGGRSGEIPAENGSFSITGGFGDNLICWGRNNNGQLGNGSIINSSIPVNVIGLSSDAAQIAAANISTCAVLTSGGVQCWGYNIEGELGNGTSLPGSPSEIPVDVIGLSSGVTAVTGGGSHFCALLSSGAVKCWGDNTYGQLGNGTTTTSSTPVGVTGLSSGVSAITGGGNHTCALLTSGGVKCWGANDIGQLGNGTTTNSSTPVDVTGLSSGVSAITGGTYHTCALLTSGGEKCWGDNGFGQLGDGTLTNRSTPVNVTGLSSGVSHIVGGSTSSCALLTSGGVKCWGHNSSGQLGNATTIDSDIPVDVTGLSQISAIMNSQPTGRHYCAILNNGGLKCWGYNQFGQLGNGTTTDSSTPVSVSQLSSTVSTVTGGGFHTCAILNP